MGHVAEHQRGDPHCRGHSNTVCGGQISGISKQECHRDTTGEHQPVDRWQIDLAFSFMACVFYVEARHETQNNRLLGNGKQSGD